MLLSLIASQVILLKLILPSVCSTYICDQKFGDALFYS